MIDEVWEKILLHEGEEFVQVRGQKFNYRILGDVLIPSTANIKISKNQVEKGLRKMPMKGPGEIRDFVFGPSYVYAILNDSRILN